ncbi:MAG TPA: hypothetical protein VK123_00815 [Candidatus Limnocylindrales bacterium]|nr:hypothetical protein [Candidatus Limnocylindrales bacterium]
MIALAIGCPVSLCFGSEQLELSAELDAPEYVVGQPVMVLLSATNVGQIPIEDVGPLEPSYGRLKLELFRAGEREPLPDYGDLITVFFSQQGLTLRPGQEACEMVDLLDHFGTWPPEIDWLGPVLWQRSLQPGEYSLQCSFRAHTGVRKGLSPLAVHSKAVTFCVLPESAALPHLQKLDRLKRSSVWQRNNVSPEQAQACRAQLPDLLGSPYFLKVFKCASFGLNDDELAEMVANLRKVSPSWSPALVWSVGARPVHTVEERKRQLASLGALPSQSMEKRIADSWRLRLEQGLYFYRGR